MFYSQFGEDKILFEIFQKKTDGLCIEVGANNGVDDSTTLFFEKLGWKCILVEPNPSLCINIRKVRQALLYEYAASNQRDKKTLFVVEGAERSDGMSTISDKREVHSNIENHGFVTNAVPVQTTTLDEICLDAKIMTNIDFISIDVEGHEYEVLEGFSLEKWKPIILLIEDNSNFEDVTVNHYLKKFGYVRFKRTGVNDWYAEKSNKQLVNTKSAVSMQWIVLNSKVKSRLRKIPILLKLRNLMRTHGAH